MFDLLIFLLVIHSSFYIWSMFDLLLRTKGSKSGWLWRWILGMVNSEDMNNAITPPASATMPLSAMVDAFEELAKRAKGRKNGSTGEEKLRLDNFCEACFLPSVLFNCLGLAFKFAELEYVAKVRFPFSPLESMCLFSYWCSFNGLMYENPLRIWSEEKLTFRLWLWFLTKNRWSKYTIW